MNRDHAGQYPFDAFGLPPNPLIHDQMIEIAELNACCFTVRHKYAVREPRHPQLFGSRQGSLRHMPLGDEPRDSLRRLPTATGCRERGYALCSEQDMSTVLSQRTW